jgi:hypothetical protein
MDMDSIYALANKVKQRLHCSQQEAEYTASLLTLEHTVSRDSFELLAEIQAVRAVRQSL